MKFSVLVFFSLACGCLGNPLNSTALLDRHARDLDVLANTRDLVTELIQNLGEAADQARESIEKFNTGLAEQASLYEEKIRADIQNLRRRVQEFAQGVMDKVTYLGEEVNNCIAANLQSADNLYSKSVEDLLSCGRDRVDDIGKQITTLVHLSDDATAFTRKTLYELRECYNTTPSTDIIALGRCIGSLAVEAELEATSYFARSAYLIGRINFSFVALPAALQACAGTQLLEAGKTTANIFRDIVACSANSVSDTYSGSNKLDFNSTLTGVPSLNNN